MGAQIRKEIRQLHGGGVGYSLHPQLQRGQIGIDLGVKSGARGVTGFLQGIRIAQAVIDDPGALKKNGT
jgi:hypothetical protein